MAITGNNTTSTRKRDLANQKSIAVGFKKTVFAHKAAAGETGISVGNLTVPSELSGAGFTNPSFSEIASVKMKLYRNNVRITSSAKGVLMDYLSYNISSSTQINWVGFTTEENEIFTVEIDHNARTGLRVVDAAPLIATSVLSAGVQDFSVGMPFEVNKYPNGQVGAVTVYVDGVAQNRNAGNATAAPGADGNYQEIDAGSGVGTIIRFNTTELYDRNITVISTGLLVEKPNEAQLAEVERVQGQVDKLVETVAELAGVPQTDFQSAPNQVDLKQFGDRVIALEGWQTVVTTTILTAQKTRKVLANTTSGAFTLTLPASPAVGDSVLVMDMQATFDTSNLTIGRNGNLISGVADDFLMDVEDAWAEFIYVGGGRGWQVRA